MSENACSIQEVEQEIQETLVVIPPDGGWGWVVVAGAFFASFMTDGIICTFGVFLQDMSDSFGCRKSFVSLTGAVMTGVFCLAGPFIAALVNRYGYRKVGIMGSVIASTSCLLTSMTTSLYATFVTYGMLGGLGYGMIYVPSVIVVGFYFEKWRPLATGISVCGAGIGSITLPPVLTVFLHKMGWQSTFRVLGLITLGCAFFTALFKPLHPVKVCAMDRNKQQEKLQLEELKAQTDNSDVTLNSTITLYKQFDLSTDVSVDTISNSNASQKDSLSVKTVKTEMSRFSTAKYADSRLSTVYEEHPNKQSCKILLCTCFRKNLKIRSKSYSKRGANRKSLQSRLFDGSRNVDPMRPMYRDDIFYGGSIIALPEYKRSIAKTDVDYTCSKKLLGSQDRLKSSVDYHVSVTKVATKKDLEEQHHCHLYPESIKRTLATMLDFGLLKSPPFILLSLNAIFTSAGYYTPYMFVKDRAIQNDIPEDLAFWLISAIGIANTVGRITCGILGTFQKVRPIWITSICLTTGGVAIMISGISYDLRYQFLCSALFGLSVASMSSLRTIIIVDMLGLENLTNAVGLILMFQGIATLGGTTISGVLRDVTGTYDISFYFAGTCICIGALFLFPLPYLSSNVHQKKNTI